jgi:hypothetical protein
MSVDSRSSYGIYLLSAKAEGFIHPLGQAQRFSETNTINNHNKNPQPILVNGCGFAKVEPCGSHEKYCVNFSKSNSRYQSANTLSAIAFIMGRLTHKLKKSGWVCH